MFDTLHLPPQIPSPAFSTINLGFSLVPGRILPSACRVASFFPSHHRWHLFWTLPEEPRFDRALGRAEKTFCLLAARSKQAKNSPYCPVRLLWPKWACRTASNCRLSLARHLSASIQCTRSWIHSNFSLAFFGTEIDLKARNRRKVRFAADAIEVKNKKCFWSVSAKKKKNICALENKEDSKKLMESHRFFFEFWRLQNISGHLRENRFQGIAKLKAELIFCYLEEKLQTYFTISSSNFFTGFPQQPHVIRLQKVTKLLVRVNFISTNLRRCFFCRSHIFCISKSSKTFNCLFFVCDDVICRQPSNNQQNERENESHSLKCLEWNFASNILKESYADNVMWSLSGH